MDEGLPVGGSLHLGELIDQHGSALAHDFQAVYGLSLRDLVADLCSDQPSITPWWVLGLVEELGENSAFMGSVAGGREFRGWTTDRHIQAGIYDAIQINTVTTARVAGAKGVKSPKPLPRPGQKASRPAGTPITAMIPRAKRKQPAKPPSIRD